MTSSVDGVVKFWKKTNDGVEFVKEFKAHQGAVQSMTVSADGRSLATAGADKTVKIFDVITFGIYIINHVTSFVIGCSFIQFRPTCNVDA